MKCQSANPTPTEYILPHALSSTPSSARDRASAAHYFCFVLPPPLCKNQSIRNRQDTLTDGVKELALISWRILEDSGSRTHPQRLSGRGHQITLHTPCFFFVLLRLRISWGIASRLYGGQTWTQRRRCETTSYHVLPLVQKGSDKQVFLSIKDEFVLGWAGKKVVP